MAEHFDELETRDGAEREQAQLAALRGNLERARELAPGWKKALDGTELSALTDRAALANLPLTRKSALTEKQAAFPPFAGLTTAQPGDA
ncbi:MAG: hypothetical protein OXT09_31605, partial [Myxococcales bacterium]|nr:hypothetical protein [Myxococcales bacterium]